MQYIPKKENFKLFYVIFYIRKIDVIFNLCITLPFTEIIYKFIIKFITRSMNVAHISILSNCNFVHFYFLIKSKQIHLARCTRCIMILSESADILDDDVKTSHVQDTYEDTWLRIIRRGEIVLLLPFLFSMCLEHRWISDQIVT